MGINENQFIHQILRVHRGELTREQFMDWFDSLSRIEQKSYRRANGFGSRDLWDVLTDRLELLKF